MSDCLVCGGSDTFEYLDLGRQPLANEFHDGTRELARYPLAVMACRTCWHSQLTEFVDPHLMFDDYLYVSGTSDTLKRYFQDFAGRFEPGSMVLDIACNDGSLMLAFEERGCHAAGVEPASRLAQICVRKDLDVAEGMWPQTRPDGMFDVITMFNVLAHTPDPFTFLAAAKHHLNPGGTIWVQTSQANMILDGTFDAIYHEHVSYFTPRSMLALARRVGLIVRSIEFVPVHGGSMLVCLALDGRGIDDVPTSLLYREDSYEMFAKNANILMRQVRGTGFAHPHVGYGAAAKGNTFLNATGLKLDWIVDDNPFKHGLLTPGTNVPIGPVENLPRGEGAIVVLAWNFWDEIIAKIRRDHGSGHTMLRFLPKIEAVMT